MWGRPAIQNTADLTELELSRIVSDLGLDDYATGKGLAGKHIGFEAAAVSGGE